MNLFKSKKFRQGSLATVLTILGIVLIILLTTLLSSLSNRFSWQLDMTQNQVLTITKETKGYIEGLNKDVEIYVLNSEDGFTNTQPVEYFVQANEIIKSYKDLSSHINVSYINILKEPNFATKYPELNLTPNNILVVSGSKKIQLDAADLFNFQQNQGSSYVTASVAEQTMTSAILNATSEVTSKVTVLTGHDESDVSAFTSLLKMNGYELAETNLLTEDIDPEVDMAILAAPKRDLSEDELRKLDKFLNNDEKYGKVLLYAASLEQPINAEMPNINAFLNDWGIAVGDSVVFESDTRQLISNNLFTFLVNYVSDPDPNIKLQPEMKTKNIFNLSLITCPLEVVAETKGNKTITALLETSEGAGIVPMDAKEDWVPSEKDLSGPIPTLVQSRSSKYDQMTHLQSTVLVLGSNESIGTSVLGSPSYANSEYFIGLCNKLMNKEDTVRIESKQIARLPMEISQFNILFIAIIVTIILPIVLVAIGLIIWLRRRNK